MEQQQKQRAKSAQAEHDDNVEAVSLVNPELDEDVDGLLAEIDSVLEVNAEEFVKNYIQHGGE